MNLDGRGTRFESDLGKDDELLPKEVATLH